MHKIGLIVYPEFQVLGLAMCAAFEMANGAVDEPVYDINLLSEHGGTVQTSAGFGVETMAFDHRPFDTLLVMGDNLIRPVSPGLVEFLRSASRTTRRLGSICTGAIALAEAGLLDGRRATTTGVMHRHCSGRTRKCWWKRTGSSSTTGTSGPRRA